jgi:L-2,4-diaminobutyric acid acetyltransferase
MQIRNCKESDIPAIRHFISLCKPLGVHTGYTYWVLFHYFSATCFLLEEDGEMTGYLSGMRSNTFEDVFFVWQIGVAEDCRGKGYSNLLLQKAAEAARRLKCRTMQFTIEPENSKAYNAFSGFAKRNNLKMSTLGKAKYPHSTRETIGHDTIYEVIL